MELETCEKCGLKCIPEYVYRGKNEPKICIGCRMSEAFKKIHNNSGETSEEPPIQEDNITYLKYSERVLEKHPIKTLFDTGEIHVYKDGIYEPDPLFHQVKSFIHELNKDFKVHDHNEIIEKIKLSTLTEREKFETDQFEICLQNGIINVKTGQFKEHSPDKLFMTKLPVSFKPDIIPLKFIAYLRMCLPIPDDYIDQLEAFASGLIKNSPKLETLFFSTGLADNGKSTFFKIMNWFYGKENISNISIHDLMDDKFAKIKLDNKRINTFPDVESGELDEFAILKPIISGDDIMARDIYQKYRRLQIYAKMFFSANELPIIAESRQTKSVFKRIRLTEWTQTFLKPDDYEKEKHKLKAQDLDMTDKELERELMIQGKYPMNKQFIDSILNDENEKSGIFNLLLVCIKHLIRRDGFFNEYPQEVIKEKWGKNSTAIQSFINECLKKDFSHYIIKGQAYQLYYNYCKSIGKPAQSEKDFHMAMKFNVLGIEEHKKRLKKGQDPTRIYVGIIWNREHSLVKKHLGRLITEAGENAPASEVLENPEQKMTESGEAGETG